MFKSFLLKKYSTPALSGYALFAGLFFAAALPPVVFQGIELMALLPFLGLLLFPVTSGRVLFFCGWLGGSVALGFYLRWFFDATPLIWLSIHSYGLSFLFTGFYWLSLACYSGIFFGAFLLLARRIATGTSLDMILFSFLWVLLEYIRTILLSFHPLVYGSGTVLGGNGALGLLGYALADYDVLRQFSSVGGVYALSFIAALPSAALFVFIREAIQRPTFWPRRFFTASLGLVIFFAVVWAGGQALSERFFSSGASVKIALVEATFFPEEWILSGYNRRQEMTFRTLLEQAASSEPAPDIVILPESALIDIHDQVGDVLSSEKHQILITNAKNVTASTTKRNVTAVWDNRNGLVGFYEKHALMAYGEYFPYLMWGATYLLGQSEWLAWQSSRRWFESGDGPSVFSTPFGVIGVRTCSEMLSPNFSIKSAADGAKILIYTASDAIVRGSPVLHAQNLAMGRIWATATRRSLAYVSNGGKSFVISPQGEVLYKSLDLSDKRVTVQEVPLNNIITPAVRYSNRAIILLGILFMPIIFFPKLLPFAIRPSWKNKEVADVY